MLSYGCTRIEIGVQSIYEDVARDTNRGHTVAAVCSSFQVKHRTATTHVWCGSQCKSLVLRDRARFCSSGKSYCTVMWRDFAVIVQRLRSDQKVIACRLRSYCDTIPQRLRITTALIAQLLRYDSTTIAHYYRVDCAAIAIRFHNDCALLPR
jgi:hypothetical protein